MITLAPFYRDIDLKRESHALAENSGIVDYRDCLAMLLDTLRATNPGCTYRVCTDQDTKLSFPESHIFRSDLRGMNLMESLVVSNTDFVSQHIGNAVLCGADHLLANSMRDIFNDDFDIALMFNGEAINNTAVLIKTNPHNHARVTKFFQDRQQAYRDLDPGSRLWLGDQISYTRALEQWGFPTDYRKLVGRTLRQDRLSIKFIEYNVDFVWGAKKSGSGYFRNAVLVDFKGPRRKQWFVKCYQRIMNIDSE